MDASHSHSVGDSLYGYEREETEKGEEQNPQPNPGYREIGPRDNSKFHDSIKAEDWDKLKKLLKRYKPYYYKKKRIQAREIEKERLKYEEEELEKEKKKQEENEDPTIFQRIRRYRPCGSCCKNPKDPTEKKSVTVAKMLLPRALTKRIFVDPTEIVSPLLMVDSDGRTPLHLACLHRAPEKMILDLLDAERKASSMRDNEFQVPLHCAIQSWQHVHIIEKIVKANANALKSKDSDGRTPLGLAVELAKEGTDEHIIENPDAPFLWISPTCKEEKNWQFEQEIRWSKVNCLLTELIDRRKVVIPSEHGLILEALEGGADPNTIVRFISSSDRYLMKDDELAGTAIGLCVERHYTLETLEYLMENCRERTTVITDIVQKAIKTHYLKGCYPLREGMVPFGKRVIDWAKKQQREEKRLKKKASKKRKRDKKMKKKSSGLDQDQKEESQKRVSFQDQVDEKDGDNMKKQWNGMKTTCKDWWEILNHLLFYCAYGRDYKFKVKPKTYHLLHAAVSAPMTPPSLIHLLLIVYPEAIREKCPMYRVLPVHIACTRWRYNIVNHDSDTSSLDQVLLHLCESDPGQLYQRHKGSLPIHMALFGGQFWAFLKSLISTEKKLLGMRDSQSKLFPFQIAALPIRFRNIQLLMRCQFNPIVWREMSFLEKKVEYESVVDAQETRQLGTIFELLRRYPDAIQNRLLSKGSSTVSRNLRSLSDLSIHFLSWIYSRSSKGGYRVRYENLMALRNSIVEARILPELEEWWIKLKECIWKDSNSNLPRTNEYLLHSALHNSETPPLVIELLIQLFPSSARMSIPGTSTFPLHIAADTAAYQSQEFEIPYGINNIHLVLRAYKEAVRLKANGRLPLHICLSKGKIWEEVCPLVMVDPSSLKVEDEDTGLVAFELMASFKGSAKDDPLWYPDLTNNQMKKFDFHQLSTREQGRELVKAKKKKELNQLTCLFELIRRKPSVLFMRSTGYMIDSDDDSSNSLNSLDDSDEPKGGIERFDGLHDSSSSLRLQGSFRDLLSPLKSDRSLRSIRSLYTGDDAPALITPIDSSINRSLTAYLLEKSRSLNPYPTPYPMEDNTEKDITEEKDLTSKSKSKYERKGTKMSLFDFGDLELSGFDDEQSSGSLKGEENIKRAKIPLELPKLAH